MRINRSIISNFNPDADVTFGDGVTVTSLAGVGDRMVVANATGVLSTQTIPSGSGTVTSIGTTSPITGGTITTTGTIGITQATTSTDGYLSSTDWNTFNGKQNLLTNPVTGTGTTNYLPKFTGASTIGDSAVSDNGTTVTLHSRALSGTSATFSSSVTANVIHSSNGNDADSGNFTGFFIGGSVTNNARTASIIKNTSGDYDLIIRSQNNTGVTTGSLIFQNGSTETMRITSGGNVGIGTTSPSSLLHLQQSNVPRITLLKTGIVSWYVGNTTQGTSNNFSIGTDAGGNNEILTVTTGGNVGIGTTSPDFLLDVVRTTTGTVATFGIEGQTINPRLRIDADEANNTVTLNPNYNGATSPSLVFKTQEVERMRITSGGNVGIGTTSPTAPLHVKTSVDDTYAVRVQGLLNNEAGKYVGIGLSGEDANTKGAILFVDAGLSYSRGSIVFALNNEPDQTNATLGNERMRITNTGNVLIGSSTDTGEKLQVNGAIKTASPTGYTAKPYKLGEVLSGGTTATHTVAVEIDGVVYFLLAADSPP